MKKLSVSIPEAESLLRLIQQKQSRDTKVGLVDRNLRAVEGRLNSLITSATRHPSLTADELFVVVVVLKAWVARVTMTDPKLNTVLEVIPKLEQLQAYLRKREQA